MSVLQDLLSQDLSEDNIRIIAQQEFNELIDYAYEVPGSNRAKTLGQAKSLLEFYDLVRQAIEMYEMRASVSEQFQVNFTQEEPDVDSETETITFSLEKREPGCFSQGPPFQGDVRNLRPILREIVPDPEYPGYRQMVTGYWYDNIVRFTCWARTNKAANARALWFEGLMEEYSWWFTIQGIPRVIYQGQDTDLISVVNENKWYGRPIDFYIKTEKLRIFSEKTLQEIILKLAIR